MDRALHWLFWETKKASFSVVEGHGQQRLLEELSIVAK